MAISKDEIKANYPLPAYNYRVTILPVSLLGNTGPELDGAAVISCSQVNGLNMEIDTVSYKHGFSFLTGVHIMAGQKKEINITVKKGVTASGRYLSDWMNQVYPIIKPRILSPGRKRDILIDLCDEEGNPLVRWQVKKALPIQLQAPTFDANTNEVAFEELKLIAHQVDVEYLNA